MAACPPLASISVTTACARARSRPWTTTLTPSRASIRAISAPIPEVLPVTSARLSANCKSIFSSLDEGAGVVDRAMSSPVYFIKRSKSTSV